MAAQRSISAAIICGSFLPWRAVDVLRLSFFRGSTTPIGGATRQPSQFRFRDQLRTIPNSGRPPQHASDSTHRTRRLHPIFIPGGGQHAGHVDFVPPNRNRVPFRSEPFPRREKLASFVNFPWLHWRTSAGLQPDAILRFKWNNSLAVGNAATTAKAM